MAFWKKFYKSKYTGAEIDAAVAKAGTVPAVSSADAGKALVVDSEGKIVAGEAGGSDIFAITLGYDQDTNPFFNKTYAQIAEAIEAGKTVILSMPDHSYDGGEAGQISNYYKYTQNTSIEFVFYYFGLEAGTNPDEAELNISVITYTIDTANNVTENYGLNALFTGAVD